MMLFNGFLVQLPQNDKKITQNGVYKNAEGRYDESFCVGQESPNENFYSRAPHPYKQPG